MMHHAMEMNHRIYWKQSKGHSLKVNTLTGEHQHSFWVSHAVPSVTFVLYNIWVFFLEARSLLTLV
jgi:hypothetical protein